MDDTVRAYHHGDLKATLLRAAEAILERDGIQALTLRAAARAAGVSHAAPANHFGDLTGLFSDLAAIGHLRLGTALTDAIGAAGEAPKARMQAMGRAYVGFARAHPALFALMFRSDRLDRARPALREAVEAARQAVAAHVRPSSPWPLWAAAQVTAGWALVHGFASLLLEGRLETTVAALPTPETVESLFEAVLLTVQIGDGPAP